MMRCSDCRWAAFYVAAEVNASVRHPSPSRRALSDDKTGSETFSFTKYNQAEGVGHSTCVSLRISPAHLVHPPYSASRLVFPMEVTLHTGFDLYDNLNHPVSEDGVVTNQTKAA